MSSFWSTSDNQQFQATTSFELGGGDIKPIPNDTTCVAAIEEASWDEYKGERTIKLKWRVAAPQMYANRVIFHKLKVYDADPKKGDRAKRMLVAIDTNAGGWLMKKGGEPTDFDLMKCLAGKMMQIKVMTWEFDGKEGNWLAAVSAKGGAPAQAPAIDVQPVDASIPF